MSLYKTVNLLLHKWAGTDNVSRAEFVENFDILDAEFSGTTGHKHTGVNGDGAKVGSGGLEDGAATDTVIGNRTVDPALITPGNTGTITQLISWVIGRIKSISGTLNWYDDPLSRYRPSVLITGGTSQGERTPYQQRPPLGLRHS
ncbi:MAG: hypothetical protein NHB14_20685 [Desulfosporosinus sp.]|nr:hypothetical protein [Desulfosporosinus sp.]